MRPLQLANEYAPEHLGLSVRDPWRWVERVNHAGGVFMGEHSFEVLGDYLAGPSHVMPTGGLARFASPLNVLDFIKIVSLIALDENTAASYQSDCSDACRCRKVGRTCKRRAGTQPEVSMNVRSHLDLYLLTYPSSHLKFYRRESDAAPIKSSSWTQMKILMDLYLLSAKHWGNWIFRTSIPILKAARCENRLRHLPACPLNIF